MKKLYGVTTAMITPFTQAGEVDYEAFERLTDFLIRRGVQCLYPCGTTGEMYHLSVAERERIAETVINQAAGRVTVYIHVGAMDQQETITLARHALENHADGVGIVTPSFFGVTDRELFHYYSTIAQTLPDDFPVYLYNIPQCSANDLKPDTVRRLAEDCPNIVGIKYSLPDLLRTDEYLHIRKDFLVMHGTDRLFLPLLAMGCSGTVSGVSNVYPELFVAVYKAWLAGDLKKAREMQTFATEACNLLKSGENMSYFKHGLMHRHVDGGSMRAPQMGLSVEENAKLMEELAEAESRWPKGLLIED
ncbi:MAG: dihydrodipicolinate synthase family protein [Eubacteriales bacterium]|nr:dihydrodipicolinate synthase family protein [Eubacteriales bacterium]